MLHTEAKLKRFLQMIIMKHFSLPKLFKNFNVRHLTFAGELLESIQLKTQVVFEYPVEKTVIFIYVLP